MTSNVSPRARDSTIQRQDAPEEEEETAQTFVQRAEDESEEEESA